MKMFKRIYIEITNICNLNCSFCPELNRTKKSMTKDDFKKVIEKIKDYTDHIYLHVKGEPLLNKDLDQIIKIANENNLNVNITTNARLLNQKISIINNNKIRQINISLHSYDESKEIKELLNEVDKVKESYISLRLWNDKDNKDVLKIIENHYNIKINIVNKRFKINEKVFIDKDVKFDWPDIKLKEISNCGTCKGGKAQLAVLVDGTVVPCCLDNDGIINLGNIFKDDLEKILNSEKYKNLIKGFNDNKLVEPLCRTCGYRKRFDKNRK